jgi:hypothetical protein
MQQKKCYEDLNTLKEAIRWFFILWLQPYKIIIVENPRMRANLQPAAGTITNCCFTFNHFFANETRDLAIDDYIKNISPNQKYSIEAFS